MCKAEFEMESIEENVGQETRERGRVGGKKNVLSKVA